MQSPAREKLCPEHHEPASNVIDKSGLQPEKAQSTDNQN
jgi:hypothetical protein